MAQVSELYEKLSEVMSYPYEGYAQKMERCGFLMEELHPKTSVLYQKFYKVMMSLDNTQKEELYIKTFDVQAICCLEVGFLFFGEDYKRGQFMAQLKQVYNQHGVDLGTELPDFLPNILMLLTRLEYGDGAELVGQVVIPALNKMLEGFGENGNVYRYYLQSIKDILVSDYMIDEKDIPVISNAKSEGLGAGLGSTEMDGKSTRRDPFLPVGMEGDEEEEYEGRNVVQLGGLSC